METLIKFKDLIIESLKDHKKLIIGLYVLFIICFIGGWILSADVVNSALNSTVPLNGTPLDSEINAFDLFIHNEAGGILTYLSSIFFAVPAVVMIMFNGANLGTVGALFNSLLPNGGLRYIIYLIPHGIFEITATVIQSAAGVLLFIFIVKFIRAAISKDTDGVSQAFDKNKKVLIHSIILMIFSTILLLIAAPIEAYFSVPFSDFIMNLL